MNICKILGILIIGTSCRVITYKEDQKFLSKGVDPKMVESLEVSDTLFVKDVKYTGDNSNSSFFGDLALIKDEKGYVEFHRFGSWYQFLQEDTLSIEEYDLELGLRKLIQEPIPWGNENHPQNVFRYTACTDSIFMISKNAKEEIIDCYLVVRGINGKMAKEKIKKIACNLIPAPKENCE